MVDLLNDFLCGRYRKCVEYLEGCEDGKFQPTQVQVQSNKAVCKVLMALSCSPVDAVKSLRTCLSELEKYLIQIRSFPPEMSNMAIEMTIVYNIVYLNLQLHTHCGSDDSQMVMSQCRAAYSKSLTRVLAAVKHLPCPSFPDQTVMSLLHKLLQYAQILQVYGITAPICFAGCVWSCLLMLMKKEKEALTCLESLTQMLPKTGDASRMSVSSSGLYLCVSVPGDQGQQQASRTEAMSALDLVGLLKGLCQYRLAQWGLSRECLSGIHGVSLLPQVNYITGLCYLMEGKADDCISVLDTALHQGYSCLSHRSRMLHLMGQCYAHKGVPHCAVLMFRQALQEDFTFPLPLFHISEQYRQLGLEDAELESLNLLVTILEDTSARNPTPDPVSLSSLWSSDIIQRVCPAPTISLLQSLYTLAHRCLQLHRYEDGSQRYLDLLATLSEASYLTQYQGHL